MMRALDRKLLRDLWHMRGMAVAISLVMIGGISTFVMSRVTYESLQITQTRYYIDQRFAKVFVNLVRAPEAVAEKFTELPGVNQVETRVVAPLAVLDPLRSTVLDPRTRAEAEARSRMRAMEALPAAAPARGRAAVARCRSHRAGRTGIVRAQGRRQGARGDCANRRAERLHEDQRARRRGRAQRGCAR
ncbi:MAG: hypothetical protein ACNA8G_01095 [Gammaproteobacteria bacterium]